MGRTLVIASGKGGTGKSVVASGLAVALCKAGKKVLLIDADEGLSSLDLILGMTDSTVYDLADLLLRRCAPVEAIRPVHTVKNLFLISASAEKGLLCSRRILAELSKQLTPLFDYILIDCPAGIGSGFLQASFAQKNVLLVATPDPVSARDAGKVNRLLEHAENVRLIINKFEPDLMQENIAPNLDDLINSAGAQLIGVIPLSDEVQRCYMQGIPLQTGRAADAFSRVAMRVEGCHVPLPKVKNI